MKAKIKNILNGKIVPVEKTTKVITEKHKIVQHLANPLNNEDLIECKRQKQMNIYDCINLQNYIKQKIGALN